MTTLASERKRLLRINEVAERLGVSPSTVRRLLGNGELPWLRLNGPGSSIRIPEDKLEQWLEGRLG
jgi:excisionase family DNA binding protein